VGVVVGAVGAVVGATWAVADGAERKPAKPNAIALDVNKTCLRKTIVKTPSQSTPQRHSDPDYRRVTAIQPLVLFWLLSEQLGMNIV